MNVYRIPLQPNLWGPTPLTDELLNGRLPEGAFVHSLIEQPWGHWLEVGHEGASQPDEHVEVLNYLLLAVQEVGYSFAEGQITKVTDRAIEMAVLWGLGGLGIGTAAENAEVAGFASLVGWLGGLFAGSKMEKVEPIFQVQLTNRGWLFTPVPHQATQTRPAVQPA